MLNTKQLLELVVEHPNRSTCDMRFLMHIWEAMTRWCTSMFDQRTGFKVLGMGEFCFRTDTIGDMEFTNPMFVMSEAFARGHELHDRRSKTHSASEEGEEMDLAKVAAITTDLLGEIVTKDVVENALRDVVDRIGEVCGDPDTYGTVTVDFGFAKLYSENKSAEFFFGEGKVPKRPCTSLSATSSTGKKGGTLPPLERSPSSKLPAEAELGLSGSSMLRPMQRTKPDAPLQRPHRPHGRPDYKCEKISREDMNMSHVQQLSERRSEIEAKHKAEEDHHLHSMQQLRGEMTMQYQQNEIRRDINVMLAEQQKQQDFEKKHRDLRAREVLGINHWPFRTEQEVQAIAQSTNRVQKSLLDAQVAENQEKRAFEVAVAAQAQEREQQLALAELNALEAERRGGRLPPTKTQEPKASVDKTLNDAFSRYEGYLNARKSNLESTGSLLKEQRILSEQAEVLKSEEHRRRMGEMKAYLQRQAQDKQKAKAEAKVEFRHDIYANGPASAVLPLGSEVSAEEEAFVKMATRQALDAQVEHKEAVKKQAKEALLEQEISVLDGVAAEVRESRLREISHKKESQDALRSAWAKQEALRAYEKTLDRKAFEIA